MKVQPNTRKLEIIYFSNRCKYWKTYGLSNSNISKLSTPYVPFKNWTILASNLQIERYYKHTLKTEMDFNFYLSDSLVEEKILTDEPYTTWIRIQFYIWDVCQNAVNYQVSVLPFHQRNKTITIPKQIMQLPVNSVS